MSEGFGFEERHESKYLIHPALCDVIRARIQGFCEPDPFLLKSPDSRGYIIHSLYFDTLSWRYYWEKKGKDLSRLKPRIRVYGEGPWGEDDVAFLEVKYKWNGMVRKIRERIRVGDWPAKILDDEERTWAEDGFVRMVREAGAVPAVHVRYRREAWVSVVDRYARVTFDRALRGSMAWGSPTLYVPESELQFVDDPEGCNTPFSPVILELKCEGLIPSWLAGIIQGLGLEQTSFSKYCRVIEGCSKQGLDLGRALSF